MKLCIDVNHKNFPKKFEDDSGQFFEGWNACLSVISSLPKFNFESKEAKWLINPDGYYPYCSNCGNEPLDGRNLKPYCENCGAEMIDGPKSFLISISKL